MSAQAKAVEFSDVSRVATDQQIAPEPNSVQMNGRAREVERIRIDNPDSIDRLIRKYSEEPEGSTMLSIAMLVAFVAVAVGAIAAGIFIAPWLLPLILFPGYLAITVPVECMARSERNIREQKVKDLEACKEAMGNEEFRMFARLTTGQQELSADQILTVHRLFEDSKSIERATQKLAQDKARLAQQLGNLLHAH